ncbi:nucleotidyltransferase family protein [Halosimplex litoreum]|uniref:Nucleotidyltransferase family protein n=1 Tax=Halosimplex litoreum TaxID=1198301 RepID=A0A7T3G0X4_9EURY|nr:nucleotidyltransferase family protein [Halosimplex litoreum]QPV64340.1 nucleotidyltransferase family protein [Halosimplex litoreum]
MSSLAAGLENDLPEEFATLLDCGRDFLAAGEAERTGSRPGLSVSATEWQAVHELARRHGMEPLLIRSVSDLRDDVGASELQRVREQRRQQLQTRALEMVAELLAVLDLFEERAVPVLVYKGPVAATRAYGDPSYRAYADLDLLVSQSAQRTALEALEQRGYRRQAVNGPVFQTVLQRPGDSFSIDLHTHVVPEFFPFELPFDRLYESRKPVEVSGRAVPTLSTEDAFLVHSIHGSKHHWFRLEWVLTTALLAYRVEDLDATLRRATDIGCDRMALLGLELADRLFDASFGSAVERRLDGRTGSAVAGAAEDIVDWVVHEDWSADNGKRTHLADFRLRSRLFSRRRDTAQFWIRALTKPRTDDVEWVSLPGWLSPLYRVVRPIRLLVEYRRAMTNGLPK